jgi:diaminohydroxyphosphoribosylaminopyrimidine deaminase/5-amino-6-(5-phosphoribosylamino)uracil reductase
MRVVLDSKLRIPLEANLVRTAREVPTVIFTLADSVSATEAQLRKAGVEVVRLLIITGDVRVDASLALASLGGTGVTRVLVEGGAALNAALLSGGLVDRIAWFRAPSLIGDDGLPAFGDLGIEKIEDVPGFSPLAHEEIGDDTLDIYRRLP